MELRVGTGTSSRTVSDIQQLSPQAAKSDRVGFQRL